MKMFASKMMIVGALLITLATGCTTTGVGSALTDAEQIAAVMKQYGEGLVEQDVDKIMVLVSENFECAEKAAVRGFWESFREQGALDDGELDLNDAATEIDGDSASVGPLYLNSALGSLTQDFYLRREADGVWRVTDVVQY